MLAFPPSLTEQWASVYFQILIGIFIFTLGIPAIEFQLVVDADVRHVIIRRQTRMWAWKSLVFALFLCALSFVWLLHPGSKVSNLKEENSASATSTRPPNNSTPEPATPSPRPSPAQTVTPSPQPTPSDEKDFTEHWQSVIAPVIVTLPFIMAIWYGLRLPNKYRRANVINQLKKRLIEHFNEELILDKDILEDLVYLGEHGASGDEKQLVLDAFKSVIFEVLKAPRYTGRELKELLESFRSILSNNQSEGNDENYFKAAQLLNETWNRVSKLGETLPANSDASLATSLLGELGIRSLQAMSEKTALAYVGFAGECRDQKTVFALGLKALRVKRFRIASGALNKLESLATSRKLSPSETTSNLLGLIAHFIDYGIASRERAEEFLLRSKSSFSPSFDSCLHVAIFYHYYNSNYDTVDSLVKMLPTASN